MKRRSFPLLTAATAAIAVSGATLAHAGTIVRIGPEGGSTVVHRSVDDGVATSQLERTGPDGGTSSVTRQCGVGGRLCVTSRQGTSASGQSWSGQSATVNGPAAVRRYGSFTGPEGNTYNRVRVRR